MVELDLDAKRAGLDPPSGPTWHVWNHHPFGHPLGPRNQEEATCQSESIERAKSQLDPNWTDSRLEDRDRLGQTASNARSAAKEAQVRAERLRDIAARQLDPLLPVPMEGSCDRGHILVRPDPDEGMEIYYRNRSIQDEYISVLSKGMALRPAPDGSGGTVGTCNVCKRGIPQGEAFWECSPCNWLACDQCNPLAVAAERAEAEEAGLSPEEWRRMVEVWRGRKRRRHFGQAAGKRLVSGRLDEQVQVTPEGRRKHHFKHTSPGGTIRSDEYFSPPGPSGDQRASCLLRIAGSRHAALPQRAALAAVRTGTVFGAPTRASSPRPPSPPPPPFTCATACSITTRSATSRTWSCGSPTSGSARAPFAAVPTREIAKTNYRPTCTAASTGAGPGAWGPRTGRPWRPHLAHSCPTESV